MDLYSFALAKSRHPNGPILMATIFKRGRMWYSKLLIGGREVRKPLSTNKTFAEELLGELVKQRNASHGGAPVDLRIDDFHKRYIEFRRGDGKKENTIEGDERALRWFQESTTAQRLSQVTPGLIENVKVDWIKKRVYKKTKKPKTYAINRDLRGLKTAFYWAQRQGFMPKQDWTQVKEIRTPKGRLHWWTVDELKKLKTVCKGMWLTFFYLGKGAGLRPSEMYWLEWADIDFVRNRIHIAPKEHWIPKDYERRWIPMPPDLREHLLARSKGNTDSRVLSEEGHIPTTDSMTVYFTRLARKAGLTGTPYTLRHTYGSHYVQNGGNIYKLKEYMGHSSIETTQIYAHLAPDQADHTIQHLPAL